MRKSVILLVISLAVALSIPSHPARIESGTRARADADSYFAKQDVIDDVHEMENFVADHSDQLARDSLPCESSEKMKLQCASVSRVARLGHRKFKIADEKSSNKLFDEAYRPQESRHFKVSESSTFVPQSFQTFDLNYADGTHLRGFSGADQVYMGDYKATTPFGVITECNSPDFNGVDGILGFGLPKRGSNLPTPVLFAMTDAENKDTNAAALKRKFSFFSTEDAAEVQLGGYDPATVSGTMWYIPAMSDQDFIVGTTSLKFGTSLSDSVELLNFRDADTNRFPLIRKTGCPSHFFFTHGKFGAPSIMDSGTSCLVIPNDNMQGQLANVPWDDFAKNWAHGKSFWLEIGQKQWEIPFSSWYLAETDQTCVQPSPEGMSGLLVGDVFFRQFIVEFDMTDKKPVIGIAPLNKAYSLVSRNTLANFELHQAPRGKLSLLRGAETMYPAEHSQILTQVDRIPVVNKKGTQYFMDVGLGTPRQKFTVIFDTGSTVFGVFTYKNDLPANIKAQLPSYYFSENLRALEQVSVSVRAAPSALFDSPAWMGLLLAANVAMLLAAMAVRRRRAGTALKRSSSMQNSYGTCPSPSAA